MGHQIEEIRIHGARDKILLKDGLPVFYPNLYATQEISGRALNVTAHILLAKLRPQNFLLRFY